MSPEPIDDVQSLPRDKEAGEQAVFPKYRDIEVPLLHELLRRGGSAEPADIDSEGRTVYSALADLFGLSQTAREYTTEDGEGRVHWEKMVRWARQKLLDRGFLTSCQRGVWEVTPEGREFAQAELEAASEAAETDQEYPEGRELLRLHRRKERSPKAVRRKKETVLAANGKLLCEVCEFDFAEVYGALGACFAECHHRVPLAQLKEEHRIRLSELGIVCANCHRMLHRRPLHTVAELRKIVLSRRGLE